LRTSNWISLAGVKAKDAPDKSRTTIEIAPTEVVNEFSSTVGTQWIALRSVWLANASII